ncbi:(S)-beta-macrocarpene synthase-like [Panicum miliaceum]|uniref:(S)-beta-macrocarpene synthase-like n=1 Tax=Panicum miliaceum TaxID=4540 RepID=A0A3L6S5U8_PANMI|nr:(S)-beta-macrocarpene synthase-like [Panicum miliaceum]
MRRSSILWPRSGGLSSRRREASTESHTTGEAEVEERDVFATFKDEEGRFTWHDPRDILGLYNAAHLRMHGETVLDEAISFARRCLESMIPYLKLEGSLAHEVIRTLAIPIPRRVRIYDYKYYISIYEKDNMVDKMLLALAKLNFNLMQIYYQQELKLLTRWWKDLQVQANFSFTRDTIVENYFWMAGAYFEPIYSRGRIILTMVMATIVILDDIYDVYGTPQECELFTKCMECWDQNAAQDLPYNLKFIFGKVLDNFENIEDGLEVQEKYCSSYLRKVLMEVVRAYITEVKWRDARYVPATVDEHLHVSARTGAGQLLSCASFVGMGEIATMQSFDWVSNMPKMVHALCVLLRLSNDLAQPYEQEKIPLDVPSTIDTCIVEHNISLELAREKIKGLIEESWKDINEEWLKPDKAQPKELLERIFNLTRTMEFMYKQGDVFTHSHAIKETINSLFVESFSEI